MKHDPRPQKTITTMNLPGQVISADMAGPFRVKSQQGGCSPSTTDKSLLLSMMNKTQPPRPVIVT
jgi:hypothetical protein